MGLKYHMEEAYIENNLNPLESISNPPIAIFSKKYYYEINKLTDVKIFDYCFIGSINSCYERRKWVIDFAKKYFTSKSIFINTDNNNDWKLLGDFDYSNKNLGFCPKNSINNQSKQVQYRIVQENLFYFQTMKNSNFVLSPAGDSKWSFRFYEVLMCKSLPIVESKQHTYRTKEESKINYEFVLSNNITSYNNLFYNEMVNKNTILFENYHMLKNNISINNFLNNKGFNSFEGHCQEILQQVQDLILLTNKQNINIMQIGFNAGHSAEIFLKNNNNLTLISFDLGIHEYVMIANEYINNTYPNRHKLILGDSQITLPKYIGENKNKKFDIIFIDGGHDYNIVKSYIENCFMLSHKDTIVILDDTLFTEQLKKHYTNDQSPTQIWNEYLKKNKIIELNRIEYCDGRGMSWGKYIN
jgi:predicted O-methyltransferase YrrM